MARLVLPLETAEREAFERLGLATGLSVPVLLELRRRGFQVVPLDSP